MLHPWVPATKSIHPPFSPSLSRPPFDVIPSLFLLCPLPLISVFTKCDLNSTAPTTVLPFWLFPALSRSSLSIDLTVRLLSPGEHHWVGAPIRADRGGVRGSHPPETRSEGLYVARCKVPQSLLHPQTHTGGERERETKRDEGLLILSIMLTWKLICELDDWLMWESWQILPITELNIMSITIYYRAA